MIIVLTIYLLQNTYRKIGFKAPSENDGFLKLCYNLIVCLNDKMLIYESKLEGNKNQYERLDNAIRTGLFVRNSIIRAWMVGLIKSRNDAYKYCKVLASKSECPWARLLNSQARA
jgi:hypothetical protein